MGTNNKTAIIPKELASYKRLRVFSIISLVVLLGGLLLSFLFWATLINKQFGLIVPFTILIWLIMNSAFKITALVNIVLLAIYAIRTKQPEFKKQRGRAVLFIVLLIVSGLIALAGEYLMLYFTEAGSF